MNLYNKPRSTIEVMGEIGKFVSECSNGKDYFHAHCLNTYELCVLADDESLTPCLARDGYWESWITSWFSKWVRPGMSVVDVGAHCGYYTMLFESLVGKYGQVRAYEPNSALVKALMHTREINDARFYINPYAVGDRDTETTLQVPLFDTGNSSIVFPLKDAKPVEVKQVKLSTHLIQPPDIIKMDIEGAEELAWRGMQYILSKNIFKHTTLVMEWTPKSYTDAFAKELQAWGDMTVIGFGGEESTVDANWLNEQDDWQMVVVRKT